MKTTTTLRAKEGEMVKKGYTVFFTELKCELKSLEEMKEYVSVNGGQIVEIYWKSDYRLWNTEKNTFMPCAIVEDVDVYEEYDFAKYMFEHIDSITDVFNNSKEFYEYLEERYPRLDQENDEFSWESDQIRDRADLVYNQAKLLEQKGERFCVSVENNREFELVKKPNLQISYDNWNKEICVVDNGYR